MGKKLLCVIALVITLLCVFASCDSGDDIPPHTHNYGEWETTKIATCTTGGTKERYCSCGKKQTSTISKTDHNYIDGLCSFCGSCQNENSGQSSTNELKYNKACSLIESGNYEEAYEILTEIKNYAPANDKLKNFFYAPTSVKEGYTYGGSSLGNQLIYTNKVYSYDERGNIKSITIVDGKTYNYTYDSKGNELTGYPIDAPNTFNGARTCTYKNGKLSKIFYSDSTDEYFYNADGSIQKIVHTYQSDYSEPTSVYEIVYTYEYYADNKIKTMRYVDYGMGYEYQYNTNGIVTEVGIYSDDFNDNYGYFHISYGEFGIEKVEVWISEDSHTELVGEYNYTYDIKGRLTEVMFYNEGELWMAYLLSDYILCYSENDNARNRIDIISCKSIEKVLQVL